MPVLNRGAANPALDWLMPRITNLHQQAFFWALIVAAAIWIFWKGSRQARVGFLCALLAVGLSDATAKRIVKNVIHRNRPCQVMTGGVALVFPTVRLAPDTKCPGSPSLPSNHAANMMALAVIGWWFTRGRVRWLWFLLPLVIGYSRVYLGFHYPTDVLAGWFLGAALAALIIAIAHRFVRPDTPAPTAPTEPEDVSTIEGN